MLCISQRAYTRCKCPRWESNADHFFAVQHAQHPGKCAPDRSSQTQIPIAFAPVTPTWESSAVSTIEACATPALRQGVIVAWGVVPGRYPTTLN